MGQNLLKEIYRMKLLRSMLILALRNALFLRRIIKAEMKKARQDEALPEVEVHHGERERPSNVVEFRKRKIPID